MIQTYEKRLLLSVIAALSILILLFLLFPRFETTETPLPELNIPVLQVIDIPRTRQPIAKLRPRPERPSVLVPVEDPELLDEVKIKQLFVEHDPDFFAPSPGDVLTELPFVPRQIIEVIPQRPPDMIGGKIVLSLRIGKDGNVREFKVVSNTTNSEICLDNVIDAAQRSRWEPIIISSTRYEYWVTKTYNFE